MLRTSSRKWGNGQVQVETTVIAIECAKEDALCLKTLFSLAYEKRHITIGIFIPTEIHWKTSPEVFKSLLQEQNDFLNTVSVIAVEGLTLDALHQEILVEGK
eukprot:11647732-Ditylum_brightwellii.AAC.1